MKYRMSDFNISINIDITINVKSIYIDQISNSTSNTSSDTHEGPCACLRRVNNMPPPEDRRSREDVRGKNLRILGEYPAIDNLEGGIDPVESGYMFLDIEERVLS